MPVITLSPSTLQPGILGFPYSQPVTASGGTAPYTYVIASGALPNGLTLNPATGLISGVPLQAGLFNFTIRATDVGACSGARPYTLTIGATAAAANAPTLDGLALIILAMVLGVVGVFAAQRFS